MSEAVIASLRGREYQALVFWKYANKMLMGNSGISKIGYEDTRVKSFDDVVIYYEKPQRFRGEHIERDHIQVKFHMRQSEKITIDALLTPRFINAKKDSFLEKATAAYRKDRGDYLRARFILYTPWDIDQNDFLYGIIDNIEKKFNLDILFKGKTERSESARIRNKLKQKLSVEDQELREILGQICIYDGRDDMIQIRENLDRPFVENSLQMYSEREFFTAHVQMLENWIKEGKKRQFTAEDIRTKCKESGLICASRKRELITVYSIPSGKKQVGNQAGMKLDLRSFFDGRFLKEGVTWSDISHQIESFIENELVSGGEYEIELNAYYSIAFAMGRKLDSKSGIMSTPFQSGLQGLEEWSKSDGKETNIPEFYVETRVVDENAVDSALFISATVNIFEEALEYLNKNKSNLKIRTIYHCEMQEIGNDSVKNGSHMWKLAKQINSILDGRELKEKNGRLHIFMAAPVALLFHLGKLSLSYGRIQMYEHDYEKIRTGTYFPGISFPVK